MRALGHAAWWLRPRDRTTSLVQLSRAYPAWSRSEVERVARASFANAGSNLVDSLRGDVAVAIEPSDEAWLRELADADAPLLILTAHLGAWEVLGRTLSRIVPPLGVVTANPHNARVDAWLRAERATFGLTTFDRHRQPLAAARWLRTGRPLAVLADLRGGVASISAPWFGFDAPTAAGPGRLAQRVGAQVVTVGIRPEGGRHWVWVGETISCNGHDTLELATRFNAALERLIREAPEHWPWFHDRWGDSPSS